MSELKDCQKEFLVDYAMKPENTWLALAIGQVRLDLKIAVFAKQLDESVKKELKKRDLKWKGEIPKPNLGLGEKPIYLMTMENQEIKIRLNYLKKMNQKKELYIGTSKHESEKWPCDLTAHLMSKDQEITEQEDDPYRWWVWREGEIEALIKLEDAKVRCEKIDYFTSELVKFAEAISEKLED